MPDPVAARERMLPAVLVASAVFLDMLLYGLVVPVVPRYARSLGAGTGLVGIIFGCYAIGLFAASPAAALLTDRLGVRRVLLGGGAGLLGSTLVWAAAHGIGMLIAARTAQGAAAAMTWTAGLSFAATSYGPRRRGQVLGWLMTAMAAGSVLGAPVGGLLAGAFGYRAPFLLTACLAAAEVLALWGLLPRGPATQPPAKVMTGAYTLLARGPSQYLFLAVLCASTAVSAAEPLLPLRLQHDFGLSPGSIGLLFGLTMAVFAVASPPAGAIAARIGPVRLMAAGLAGLAAVMPGLALGRSVLAVTCVLVVLGVCFAAVMTSALAALASFADATDLSYATTYALLNTVYAGGMLLGPIEAGLIAQSIGLPWAFSITGVLCLTPIAVTRRTRNRPPRDITLGDETPAP